VRTIPPLFLALTLQVAIPSTASADIPPPQGYVETCTVEHQQGLGRTGCEQCTQSRARPDARSCASLFANRGKSHVCTGGGATVYHEIWCETTPDAPPASNTPPVAPPSEPTTDTTAVEADILALIGGTPSPPPSPTHADPSVEGAADPESAAEPSAEVAQTADNGVAPPSAEQTATTGDEADSPPPSADEILRLIWQTPPPTPNASNSGCAVASASPGGFAAMALAFAFAFPRRRRRS
jgi:MYXO-CTERM domain-containing protein